jgi:F0F1-type ATP synthase membrane subunit c/vacuolar-type H+-ATPase subunit K
MSQGAIVGASAEVEKKSTVWGAALNAFGGFMIAAKAGSEMLSEKPELSIWALLFIALGEGLAIYGLIVTILMVNK